MYVILRDKKPQTELLKTVKIYGHILVVRHTLCLVI